MDNSSFKNAGAFVELDSRDLKTVFQKIHLLKQLSQKVLGYLEPEIAKFCQVANLRDGKLTLIAANGSIATQLRFQTTDLLKKFQKDTLLSHILSIEYKVRPPQALLPERFDDISYTCMEALSPETAELVNMIAESIEDPKLNEIMKRIAGRVKPQPE